MVVPLTDLHPALDPGRRRTTMMDRMQALRRLPILLVLLIATGGASAAQGAQATQARRDARLPDPPAMAAGATYVGDGECATCHENVTKEKMGATLHGKASDARTPAAMRGCETCHGPASKHMDDPEKNPMRRFGKISADEASAVCTACHASGDHALWSGSKHETRQVSCTSCHSMHAPKSAALVKTESQTQVCASCHRSVVNKMNRFNHMPVREGAMACNSCHNVHGSANVRMLRTGTNVDQSCTSCHAEKRGPYLWEHAPVANSCVTCHDAHGSNNDRMLVAKQPYLCQRCHVTSRHPPTVYNAFMLNTTSNANKMTGRACVSCHSQIHGSNSPNGFAFIR
jgi:DmsE family decaheme c-type cytochrome